MHRASQLACAAVAAVLIATSLMGMGGAAQATPSKPVPDSIVRMDTGTAYSKALGNHRYSVSLPAKPNIQWMGTPRDGGLPPMGTLKPQDVAKAWTALGHRANVGVPTRVTWNAPGEDFTDWRSGYLTNPRMGKDGRLTVTLSGVRGGLPKVLPDFTLNVSPSSETPRTSYPAVFYVTIAGTADKALSITANSLVAGNMTVDSKDDSGNWATCSGVADPLISMGGPNRKNFYYGPVVCGGITIEAGDASYIGWYPARDGSSVGILPCYRVEVPTGSQGVSYCSSQITIN